MENKMALSDSSELLCLVCNSNIDLNSCINIFYVSLPHNGEILANFVLKVLKLSTSDLRSSYVCLQCYNLFGMLEQAEWTAANIQCEIFKAFQTSSNGELSTNNSFDSISKVTENFSEAERLNQIKESKIIIAEQLSEKDFNTLNSITNQITNDSVICNEIEIKHNIESQVISSNEESILINYENTSIKNCLENYKVPNECYKTETVNLNDDTPIFAEKVIKTEDPKNFEWQDEEDISNIQNSTNINESIDSHKTLEDPAPNPTQKSQKSSRISNSQKSPKHTCPNCNKMWSTINALKTHMKSHSTLRPYMCEKCGKSYKHKHALDIHVGMHNGVNPFQCSHCDKCFTQKGALQRHLPIHTGETPYQCEMCEKRFVHHTSYNMHVLSHTGKKSFKCQICNLSLISTSHLKRHMRVHTGEKPYICVHCGRSFAERYNLLSHQKTHDPSQPPRPGNTPRKRHYKCGQCDESFTKKEKLNEHHRQHLAEDSEQRNDKWLDLMIDEDPLKPSYTNAADLLEACVNEVFHSLSRNGAERL